LVPHGDPFGRLLLVSVHDGVPPVQASTPAWHGLVGVQAAPGEQAAHEPLSHTIPVPQLVPSATLPVSPQTGEPVEHPMDAVWHGLVDVQVAPDVQATHEPLLLQTSLVPHVVPVLALTPVSTHSAEPLAQDTRPTWQALEGTHATPAVHASPEASGAASPESTWLASWPLSCIVESGASADGPSKLPSPDDVSAPIPSTAASSSSGPSPETGNPHPASHSVATRAETPAQTAR